MDLRIKELRLSRKWTGSHLADLVGVTKGYISEIETGKKTPGGKLLMVFAEVFQCEVHELFAGDAEDAELAAHLEVMRDLSEDDRRSIERAALGLLAKRS